MAAPRPSRALRHRQPDRVPGPGHALPVGHRLLHPGRPHEPDPPHPRHRLRAPHPADEPRRDRGRDAPQRRALGPGPGADPRHVAALHPRQDDARDPLPAAADRPQVPGQALRGRHGRPLREGAGGAPRSRAHQALGPGAQLAAAQLREPRDDGPVGAHRGARPARVPAHLPPQHRAPGGGGLGGAARPRRPRDDRGPGRGPRPPRRAEGDLRHRPARVAQPAPPGDAAPAPPRVGEGADAGAAGAGGGPARAAGALGGHGRAPPEGRERRGAGRRGRTRSPPCAGSARPS